MSSLFVGSPFRLPLFSLFFNRINQEVGKKREVVAVERKKEKKSGETVRDRPHTQKKLGDEKAPGRLSRRFSPTRCCPSPLLHVVVPRPLRAGLLGEVGPAFLAASGPGSQRRRRQRRRRCVDDVARRGHQGRRSWRGLPRVSAHARYELSWARRIERAVDRRD